MQARIVAMKYLLVAMLASAATAGDTDLERLSMGEYWYGAQVDLDDLRGKVVLVEYWGS